MNDSNVVKTSVSDNNSPPCTGGHDKSKPKPKSAAQMNMKGVFLHVLADALGSVIVMISATIILQYPEWKYNVYIDPTLSMLMVMLILKTTWPLCKYLLFQNSI